MTPAASAKPMARKVVFDRLIRGINGRRAPRVVAKPAPMVRPNASPTLLPPLGSQREGSGQESYKGTSSKHWAYSLLEFEEFVQSV